MSNKIVPAIYRNVIDDVISSIKGDFDEYGVSEDVLAELQRKWETKVVASHVAEFEAPTPPPPPQYPPHAMHPMAQHPHYPPTHNQNPYAPAPGQPHMVKTEPIDSRYILQGHHPMAYTVPHLPGPQLPVLRQPPQPVAYQPPGPGRPAAGQNGAAQPTASSSSTSTQQRIPQVDGPSSSGSDSSSPPPQQYAPHSSHPSLPQPSQTSTTRTDDEAINSDLDDSDSEGEEDVEEGGPGESDIVFCTYDKVARVKNKWKCILKDGMIHVNGKDYLFAKCTGEFEW